MYRCIVGFRTMGPVDILSLAGGQPGTMRVLEHWPPGSLCGEGDSSALQASSGGGEVPGAMLPAQPHHPSPPGCLGMCQPCTSLPLHTGSVRGALCCPKIRFLWAALPMPTASGPAVTGRRQKLSLAHSSF